MSLAVPGFERKKEDNPYGYTEDQIADRKIALKLMREMWPDVNPNARRMGLRLSARTLPKTNSRSLWSKVETEPSKHLPCNDPRSHLYEKK
jgi:allophanate hydrolase subunit 2